MKYQPTITITNHNYKMLIDPSNPLQLQVGQWINLRGSVSRWVGLTDGGIAMVTHGDGDSVKLSRFTAMVRLSKRLKTSTK